MVCAFCGATLRGVPADTRCSATAVPQSESDAQPMPLSTQDAQEPQAQPCCTWRCHPTSASSPWATRAASTSCSTRVARCWAGGTAVGLRPPRHVHPRQHPGCWPIPATFTRPYRGVASAAQRHWGSLHAHPSFPGAAALQPFHRHSWRVDATTTLPGHGDGRRCGRLPACAQRRRTTAVAPPHWRRFERAGHITRMVPPSSPPATAAMWWAAAAGAGMDPVRSALRRIPKQGAGFLAG